ncbi:hypothetical protein I6F14_33585 [Bradyrhizobium sp. IC3069]|uniref:hypothetical protein n=1 Tax=unclassified Bradyrhizobium TaxID=2631580 RepID=UPI001CD4F018|nr:MULTISPECIES: hypothetical protein [unclassified Bradyrhizobium]MCA1365372.1 hypothetical protein [Bradyrhizobium sp. IC4059]MCA1522867.1 hypothetical protein [Bradyrhizobium sp. IC3069]
MNWRRTSLWGTIAISLTAMFGDVAHADEVAKIGIAQFGRHPQLDLITESFKEELSKLGHQEGKNVSYNLKQVLRPFPCSTDDRPAAF